LKGIIAKYEANKVAPGGAGDVNAALAALKIEKLAVDGELVTVKAEVEALNKKCTATRDEVNMVQAKLTLSEDKVTSEKRRTDKAIAEVNMLKTALADETAKYQDLLKKAPTGPPPPGTAHLKDRLTTLLEELQKLVPRLQSQPFVNRVKAITDLINRIFDDISSIHDKRQILTLMSQSLFPGGDQELRRDLARLLAVHGV
jgi:chromosome segregation ATPase